MPSLKWQLRPAYYSARSRLRRYYCYPTLLSKGIGSRNNLGRGKNCRHYIYWDSCFSSDSHPHLLFHKVDHARIPNPQWPISFNHYNLRWILVNEKVSITEQKANVKMKNQTAAN
jgi:hypothetical protein